MKINYLVEILRHKLRLFSFHGHLKQDSIFHKNINNSELGKVILSDVDQFVIYVLRPFIDGLTSIVCLSFLVVYLIIQAPLIPLIQISTILLLYVVFYNLIKPYYINLGKRVSDFNKQRFKSSLET